jgi:hypothetical protein
VTPSPRDDWKRAAWNMSPATLAGCARQLPWRLAYASWPDRPAAPTPGYTLILPVPADLPVFARLAIANTLAQDPEGRVETIVVPDARSAEIHRVAGAAAAEFGTEQVRVVDIAPGGRRVQERATPSPHNNHWLQFATGAAAMTTTHGLIHDADLFITDSAFLARHYQRCAADGLACLGVSPAWDDWLREHGLDHVVATWELMFSAEWARSFAPWEHKSRPAWVDGEWHIFDNCLATQSRTAPSRIGLNEDDESFVHFNWVIGVYRHFQNHPGDSVEDRRFVLLLIRLLVDALSEQGATEEPIDVPSLDDLAGGIGRADRRVTYASDDTAAGFSAFRERLDRVLSGPLVESGAADRIRERLAPFERAFA